MKRISMMIKNNVIRSSYGDLYGTRVILASFDICPKCVSCPFDPLNRRSSLGNMRCLCVLFFLFVNVIRFLIVKRHPFLMR